MIFRKKGGNMKKKLMILLIAALFVAMVFSTGCKKKFDITGVWTVNTSILGMTIQTQVTFSGSRDSGVFIDDTDLTGSYTVNGDNVSWEYSLGAVYTGVVDNDNSMHGTKDGYITGTWTAVR